MANYACYNSIHSRDNVSIIYSYGTRNMVKRLPKWIGKKGIDISLRLVVLFLVFAFIIVILAYILTLFYPQPSFLDKAYAAGSRIFNLG